MDPRSLIVVFLDLDGVLITPESSFRRSRTGVVCDPDAVAALNFLTGETGAQLVVSSAWRLEYTFDELSEMLQSWGVRARVLGITRRASNRCDEIQTWIDEHSASLAAFVILDDMTDMGHLSSRLVCTDFEIGLTMSHSMRACELLSFTI